MSWNFRIVRTTGVHGAYFGVHEAFYHKRNDTVPHSITENPVTVAGDDVDGCRDMLDRMRTALTKPILELVDNKVIEWIEPC